MWTCVCALMVAGMCVCLCVCFCYPLSAPSVFYQGIFGGCMTQDCLPWVQPQSASYFIVSGTAQWHICHMQNYRLAPFWRKNNWDDHIYMTCTVLLCSFTEVRDSVASALQQNVRTNSEILQEDEIRPGTSLFFFLSPESFWERNTNLDLLQRAAG